MPDKHENFIDKKGSKILEDIQKLQIQRRKKVAEEDQDSEFQAQEIKKARFLVIQRFIHARINPDRRRCITMTMSVFMILLTIIHFVALSYKVPIIKEVQYNIKNQSIALDVFTWECWAQVSTVMALDIARASREGWLLPTAG